MFIWQAGRRERARATGRAHWKLEICIKSFGYSFNSFYIPEISMAYLKYGASM
jgi:hypothetical protein